MFYQGPPKYTLSLLVIAKNEEMVIQEFIEHYKWQGVEHIYLIDNGSTDNMVQVLTPYIHEGYVSYYFRHKPHVQIRHYNNIYAHIRRETKWMIICDTDEYIYNRTRGQTIKDYIDTVNYDTTNAVQLQWKMFGSSGYVTQPVCIRKSFLLRRIELDPEMNSKSIINTEHTNSLKIHTHNYKDRRREIIKCPPELALNHYAIMSLEYFQKVKIARGAADVVRNVRNMDYFHRYDHKEIQDMELNDLL
jgi:glycosyltransferase involved in cell wall biosynthesis